MASVHSHVFGAKVINEAVKRANISSELIDDVILGNVLNGGGNIVRLTALQAGLPLRVPCKEVFHRNFI